MKQLSPDEIGLASHAIIHTMNVWLRATQIPEEDALVAILSALDVPPGRAVAIYAKLQRKTTGAFLAAILVDHFVHHKCGVDENDGSIARRVLRAAKAREMLQGGQDAGVVIAKLQQEHGLTDADMRAIYASYKEPPPPDIVITAILERVELNKALGDALKPKGK